jgi:nucleotide-binding universal stress UspA family protein
MPLEAYRWLAIRAFPRGPAFALFIDMSVSCGTDFSAGTHDAVQVAAMLAARWNEPLQLVHAIDTPLSTDWDNDLRALARDAAARRLHAEAERVAERGPLTIEESLAEGPADEVLVSTGAAGEASLVVLGALGRRARAPWRIGGTAERVAATAKSAVLVVRAASPFEAWLRGERALRIVVGDDLTLVSAAALRWTAKLRHLGPCDIVVCHVFSLIEEKSRLGVGGPLYARIPELEQANLAALRRHAGPSIGVEGVRYRVEGTLGRPAEPLLAMAADEAADLVVVGTAQRGRLNRARHGWTTQIVLNDARSSVACVPAHDTPAEAPSALPTLRRVLAATDFSPLGNQAVAYAHAIVAAGGTVHILHVEENGHSDAADRLRKSIPVTGDKSVETQIEVMSVPNVSAAITGVAERLDVDVVCIGTHGFSGLPGIFLGSVAQQVTERCRRQVLLVPPRRADS